MSRTNRAVYTTVANSVANYAGLGMSLLSIPVLLEHLGKEDYGLFLTVLSFNGFFSLGALNILGGTRILIALANGKSDTRENEISKIFTNGLFLSLVLGGTFLAILAGYSIVAYVFNIKVFALSFKSEILFMLLGVQVILGIIGGNFSNLFEALQDGYIQQLYYGSRRVLGVCLMMVAAIYTGSVVYVMLISIVSLLFEYILIAIHATRRYKRFLHVSTNYISREQLKTQVTTGSKSFLYEVASLVKVSGIIWVISLKLGNEFVPDFTVTRSIIFSVIAVFLNFSRSLQPAYGEAYQSADHRWIKNSIVTSVKGNLFLPLIIVFVLYPAVNDILFAWIDLDINFSTSLFLAVALYAYFNYANQSLLLVLNGINKQKMNMVFYLVDALLSLVLGFVLLSFFADITYMILASAIVSVVFLPMHLRGLDKNVLPMAGILESSFYRKYLVFFLLVFALYLGYDLVRESESAYLSIYAMSYLVTVIILAWSLLRTLRVFDHSIHLHFWKVSYKLHI